MHFEGILSFLVWVGGSYNPWENFRVLMLRFVVYVVTSVLASV
jgi:hypothetical protein